MSKSQIVLETNGEDSNNSNTTYALKTHIKGKEIIFPTISPHKIELFRSKKRSLSIDSPFATYIEHVPSLDDFLENYQVKQSEYEEFAKTHSDKIVNYSFDLLPSANTTVEVVRVLREIQINAESPFLFEYENNITQSVTSLNAQISDAETWLQSQDPKKILVPVIDMKITEEGLFLKKLESLSNQFNRINVIYRSPNQAQANWADLNTFLKNNKIWCHMDCILNRYNSDKIAHRVRLYAMGVLSSSVGFPFGGGSSTRGNRIFQFDPQSHTYEMVEPPYQPSFAEKQDRTWIKSLNDEISELQKMRDQVTRKTLYTQYLPSKSGSYLVFTKGI